MAVGTTRRGSEVKSRPPPGPVRSGLRTAAARLGSPWLTVCCAILNKMAGRALSFQWCARTAWGRTRTCACRRRVAAGPCCAPVLLCAGARRERAACGAARLKPSRVANPNGRRRCSLLRRKHTAWSATSRGARSPCFAGGQGRTRGASAFAACRLRDVRPCLTRACPPLSAASRRLSSAARWRSPRTSARCAAALRGATRAPATTDVARVAAVLHPRPGHRPACASARRRAGRGKRPDPAERRRQGVRGGANLAAGTDAAL